MDLELNNICKSFDEQVILQNISFHENINSVAVLGPSGGGKSTLLRIVGGLLDPTAGSIKVDGEILDFNENNLQKYRKNIGFVFQSNGLFEHMTAVENMILPLIHTFDYNMTDAMIIADKLFDRCGLSTEKDKYPSQLSGGQQQRIAIARAVATKPKLLLLDEPTSALDPEYTIEVLDMLGELQAEGLKTIVVTHEMGFAKNACETVMFLTNNTIVEIAKSSEFFNNPKTPQAQRFLDKILEWKV